MIQFDDWRNLSILAGVGAVIGFAAAFLRLAALNGIDGVGAWRRGLTAGALVGILGAWVLDSIDVAPTWKGAAIIVASCMAGDILHGITLVGRHIREDPIGVIQAVIASLRGGKR